MFNQNNCLKSLILALTALVMLLSAAHAVDSNKAAINSNKPVKDKWALVVGISQFENPRYNLKFASKDARDFASALVEKFSFKPDHIKLLLDDEATKENIMSLLGDTWLPRVARPDDVVVIYFSTHGSPSEMDVGQMNFLMAHDSDIKKLFATGVSMQNLASTIKQRVPSSRVVIVLDSCHSGAANPESKQAKGLNRTFNVDAASIAQGTGQLVITSSNPRQRSWESKRYNASVFTKHFIDGLARNGESTTLGDAFDYTLNKVQEEVQRDRGVMQTPVLKSKWEGDDLLLAAKPTDPKAGLDTDVGDIKLMVVPKNYSDAELDDSEEESVLEVQSTTREKSASSAPKPEAEKVEETTYLKRLPDKFRFKITSRNLVNGIKYNHGGVYEWNPNKLYYAVKYDSGQRGKAHVEKLDKNQVIIKENTRFFWGMCKNRLEGDVTGNRVKGTMGGHDSWTKWSGTWEAWW